MSEATNQLRDFFDLPQDAPFSTDLEGTTPSLGIEWLTRGQYNVGISGSKREFARICGFELKDLEGEVGSGGRFATIAMSLPPATVPFTCRHDLDVTWHLNLLPPIAEQVAAIRAFLALNVSETARVLGVERPTIYAWVTSKSRPHPGNRERIERLYSLARRWSRITSRPLLDWYEEQGGNREQVVDSLREPAEGQRVFEALRSMWSERIDTGRFLNVRESAERLGLEQDRGGQDRIDFLTGRRVSNE